MTDRRLTKARDLQEQGRLTVKVRQRAAERGHDSMYALHQAMLRAGVSLTYRELCRIAVGDTTMISFDTVTKLCDALECQPGDLYTVHTKRRKRRGRKPGSTQERSQGPAQDPVPAGADQ